MVGCPLNACRICTACAHHRHCECRGKVTCPDTHVTAPCHCCAPVMSRAPVTLEDSSAEAST